jgi:hypothetical protein
MLQANLAAHELMQIGRQLLSSLIAEQAARREYVNVQTQIAQSQEIRQFLDEKFTNEELYSWMQGEVPACSTSTTASRSTPRAKRNAR